MKYILNQNKDKIIKAEKIEAKYKIFPISDKAKIYEELKETLSEAVAPSDLCDEDYGTGIEILINDEQMGKYILTPVFQEQEKNRLMKEMLEKDYYEMPSQKELESWRF